MNKKTNSLIAALTLTAIVLGVVLLTNNSNRPAQANMLNAQAEFSLMTTGPAGADESLVIIDKEAGKMIVYKLVNGTDLNVMAFFDFGKNLAAPAK